MTSLVKDYNLFKQNPNITFIGICTSSTGTIKTMASQVKLFNLTPFANMLDAGGATAASYGIPRNSNFRLVVIDGESKIAYNASRGWMWSGGPDAGRPIHHTQVEKSLKQFSGILGTDITVPPSMKQAAHLFDLQQFELLESEMNRVLQSSSNADDKRFAEKARMRVSEHRRARLRQIQEMAADQPIQAYRDAIAFVEAFPRAEEMAAVKSVGAKLISNPKVKQEMDAEAGFHRIMVPEMKKVNSETGWNKTLKPLLDGYMKAFGTTEYAAVVQNAMESHRLAVGRK